MGLRGILSVFRIPHLWSVVKLGGDLRAYVRLNFLYAAFDSGLLHALRTPATKPDALGRIGAKRPELAEALLELGVALGELSYDGRTYALRGRRARAMATEMGDPLAAWLQENVCYHGDVYRNLAERTKGADLGRYLEAHGKLIARSSRVLEPMVAVFVKDVVKTRRPARLLEVGCGSGVYLRHAAAADPTVVGVAIDVQEDVLAAARANLARWGIADRFQLVAANVLDAPAAITGRFDLVTLYNNVCYFQDSVRVELFRRLASWLNPGGALAIVSALRGGDPETINFDLVLRSTAGCAPLPAVETLTDQLRASGVRACRSREARRGRVVLRHRCDGVTRALRSGATVREHRQRKSGAFPGGPILEKIYLANATLLVVHEIDSAYWREWELFHLPAGLHRFPGDSRCARAPRRVGLRTGAGGFPVGTMAVPRARRGGSVRVGRSRVVPATGQTRVQGDGFHCAASRHRARLDRAGHRRGKRLASGRTGPRTAHLAPPSPPARSSSDPSCSGSEDQDDAAGEAPARAVACAGAPWLHTAP